MDTILEKHLVSLQGQVGAMAGLVESSLKMAIKALAAKEMSCFDKIMENETQINSSHKAIDRMVFKLLARQSPVASDLRMILAVSKMNVDLERMGDLTRSIAFCVKEYLVLEPILLAVEIPKMGDLVQSMVSMSIKSFLTNSEELSSEVLRIDDKVDAYRDGLIAQLKTHMENGSTAVEGALSLLTIIRNLERIGDHATNVSEDVIFYISGQDVRHGQRVNEMGGEAWKGQ